MSTHNVEWHEVHAKPTNATTKKIKTTSKPQRLLDAQLLHGENPHQHDMLQSVTLTCDMGNESQHMQGFHSWH